MRMRWPMAGQLPQLSLCHEGRFIRPGSTVDIRRMRDCHRALLRGRAENKRHQDVPRIRRIRGTGAMTEENSPFPDFSDDGRAIC